MNSKEPAVDTRVRATVGALCLAVFGALAVLVGLGAAWPEGLDRSAARGVHRLVIAHPLVVQLAEAATLLGNPALVDVVVGALAVGAAWRRRWWLALGLCLARAVQLSLETLVKHAIGRPRPVFADAVAHASGFSYPSGHSAGAALYLTLVAAAVVTTSGAHRRRRACSLVGCGLVAVAVATSRLLLGVHYLSDVVGGLALGLGVALLMTALVGASRLRTGRARGTRPTAA